MPLSSTARRLFGLALVAATTTAAVASLLAAQPAGDQAAFRRPAPLVDNGSAAEDPVWRLGRRLFFDTELSRSGETSCASCHQAEKAWSSSSPKAVGDNGQSLAFKAPTLLNVGWLDRLGWIGRFGDTAAVSLFAMKSAATMNMPLTELVSRLRADPRYVTDFKNAFHHDTLADDDVSAAITRYVNSITSAKSPFDDWVEGNPSAIGEDAKRGFAVFAGKGRCGECHSGWMFTDGSFHDIGTAKTDPGRGQLFPTSVKLQHAFKTPGLRGVVDRAPYMHDGSVATLDDVVDLYDHGGIDRPSRAEAIGPLHLSAQQKIDLKAFLRTLSSGTDFVVHP